jgi:hypothetical protein
LLQRDFRLSQLYTLDRLMVRFAVRAALVRLEIAAIEIDKTRHVRVGLWLGMALPCGSNGVARRFTAAVVRICPDA